MKYLPEDGRISRTRVPSRIRAGSLFLRSVFAMPCRAALAQSIAGTLLGTGDHGVGAGDS